MFRKIAISAVSALGLMTGAAFANEGGHVEDVAFSFEGPFGSYDEHQLQRGLQVYTEVCSSCHGLNFVTFRTLGDEGGPQLPEDQVRAYAKNFSVLDEDANRAALFDVEKGAFRAPEPKDFFPINGTQGAPDLSLMAKARAGFSGPYGLGLNQFFKGMGGAEYIVGLLNGYSGEEKEEAGSTFYENHVFSTGWVKMPAPLADGQVEFADGSPNDVKHMSEDVAAFLMWTAEPKLNARKDTGFKAVIFLIFLSSLLYLTNKKLWANVKGAKKH